MFFLLHIFLNHDMVEEVESHTRIYSKKILIAAAVLSVTIYMLNSDPQTTTVKQLNRVPRSLGGRSNKARKIARIGTACRRKTRMGGFNLDTKNSRNIIPGIVHQ
jgi:hypothetical protein